MLSVLKFLKYMLFYLYTKVWCQIKIILSWRVHHCFNFKNGLNTNNTWTLFLKINVIFTFISILQKYKKKKLFFFSISQRFDGIRLICKRNSRERNKNPSYYSYLAFAGTSEINHVRFMEENSPAHIILSLILSVEY